MYIFIYIYISISPSSHAGGRCHKINTHMHEWEYEDAATHAHILGVPSPNRYIAVAKFCFCKNNKRLID